MTKHYCPCCNYEFNFGYSGDYGICPICLWEDDPIQYSDPDYSGGANELSLNEYKLIWSKSSLNE